ncbi:CoA-binding protein [Flavobacteriaceae bacterium KMM 6898]|nr:CoA-binding protein [Flavobacteriaceae bacterium KMM 6898]
MKKTLVFGASLKPDRYSYVAVKRLVANEIETEAFGLKEGYIDTVQVKTTLEHMRDIHTLTLYIGPQRQAAYYDSFLALSPKRVIFNPGTENPELYDILEKQGILVEVACTLVLLGTGQY